MDPKLIKALLDALTADDAEAIKAAATALLAALAAPGAPIDAPVDAPPDPALDALNADPEPPPAKLAALTALREQTGCASLGEAVAMLTAWKLERDKSNETARVLDESSRFGLVAELVKLNVETPATAWIGEGKDRKLVARLSVEPVADMRARVATLRASRGTGATHEPPETKAGEGAKPSPIAALSADTLAAIKAKGMTPEQFIEERDRATKRSS